MNRKLACFSRLCVLVVSTISAYGQATTSVRGRITDPSGAAIPSAQVQLTRPDTNFSRHTEVNNEGVYEFLQLPPGTYALSVSAAGFVTAERKDLALQVNLPATVDFQLQIATGAQQIEVSEAVAMVNTTDATLGNVFDSKQVEQLPIEARNVVELLSLQAGVMYLGNRLDQDSDTRSGAVNGVRSDQSNVTLDGIDVNDQNNGYAFQSVLNVPPDSVEEFRVTTANANADSGYSSGGQVALVTKSGTNNFHGSAYEYNRNTIFSANDPFLKESQLSNGEPNKAPKLLYNVFGVAVGGPVVKNRLFFFVNYEGKRQAQGTSVLRDVPSSALQGGFLQYLCQRNSDGSLDTADCPGGTVNGLSGVQPGYYALSPSQVTAMDPLGK